MGSLWPEYPAHASVTSPSGPRYLRQTLQSAFHPDVPHLLLDRVLPLDNYQEALRNLHTAAVATAIKGFAPNRALGTSPIPYTPQDALSADYRAPRWPNSDLAMPHTRDPSFTGLGGKNLLSALTVPQHNTPLPTLLLHQYPYRTLPKRPLGETP